MARSLLAQTLDDAHAFASAIVTLDDMAKEGRQSEALAILGNIRRIAEAKLPIITAVTTAQREAAELMDRAQRTRVLCSIGIPEPKPHAPNDHHQAPSEPDPIIA